MAAPIEIYLLTDDGLVPNNPHVPARVYRGVLGPSPAEREIIDTFARNGWSNAWVNGIYSFHHYHATVHEVLGIACGTARVQLGGPSGPVVALAAGDAVLIPAGVGHCRLSASGNLSVVGAYPDGADWDLVRATPAARLESLGQIEAVPHPRTDPILGGPFVRI